VQRHLLHHRKTAVFESLFHRDTANDSPAEARTRMVAEQLRGRGVRDERVLAAMAKVPREPFILPEDMPNAYGDFPLPIGAGQTISQPYIVAAMLEKLDLQPDDRVLEVGTGTGYEAAILGELAAEIWTIERHEELAARARTILQELGYTNVHVVHGDGSRGLPHQAPFTKILVAAAAPRIPEMLVGQLADGGSMILPVGTRDEQQLQVVRKVGAQTVVTSDELCRFVPLLGEQGWQP
jgi:protein-L-isoaspartate(D-aspartate) O-methyltransferase